MTYATPYGPWRDPDEETEDYPGFVVHDGRVSGSITAGKSRLPLWAFVYGVAMKGWPSAADDYRADDYLTAEQFSEFLTDLLEQRGEFARLLCILADEERRERTRRGDDYRPWWKSKRRRKRVADALRRCLATLGEGLK